MSTQGDAKQEYPVVDLTQRKTNPNLALLIPINLLKSYNAVCILKRANVITIAMADPTNAFAKHDMQIVCTCGDTFKFFRAEVAQIIEFRAKQVAAWKTANPGKKIDGLNLPSEKECAKRYKTAFLKVCTDPEGMPELKFGKVDEIEDIPQDFESFMASFPSFASKTGEGLQHDPETLKLRRVNSDGEVTVMGILAALPRQDDDKAEIRMVNVAIRVAIEQKAKQMIFSLREKNAFVQYLGIDCTMDNGASCKSMTLPRLVFEPLMKRFKAMAGVDSTAKYATYGSYVARHNAQDYHLDFQFLPTATSDVCVVKIQYKQDELPKETTIEQVMRQPGIILCKAETPQQAEQILQILCHNFIPEGFPAALIDSEPQELNLSNMFVVPISNYNNLANAIVYWAPVVQLLVINAPMDFDSAHMVCYYSKNIPIVVWANDTNLVRLKFMAPEGDTDIFGTLLVMEGEKLTLSAL